MSSNNGGNGHSPVRHVPHAAERLEDSTLLHLAGLVRRRGWILGVVTIATMAAFGFVGATQPPEYRSEAVIEIGPDRPVVSADGLGDPLGGNALLWENHFRTQEAMLRRPGLLARVLETVPPAASEAYRREADPVQALSDRLRIEAVPSTFLIRIGIEHDSAEPGPLIVNALATLHIDEAEQRLRRLRSGALEVLGSEALPAIRQKVDEAEARLQDFQAQAGTAGLEERYSMLVDAKRRLSSRFSELRLRRIFLESGGPADEDDLVQHPGALPPGAADGTRTLETLEAERARIEQEIAKLALTHKPRHPAMASLDGQLDQVNQRIRHCVRAGLQRRAHELAAAGREEDELRLEESRLDMRLSDSRTKLAQFRKLDAEVVAARELYNSYLKKHGEVKATSGSGLVAVRIVDLARGARETSTKAGFHLSLGLVLGLLLGAAAMLLVEQLDDRIRSPRDASAALHLDVIAAVPRLPREPVVRPQPLAPFDNASSMPLEPFRRLRTEIAARLDGGARPRIVAVVSPQEGDGRSTIAINLARVLALEGRRVLLVDAHFRRPRLKSFLTRKDGLGLDDYLRGDADLEAAAQMTWIPRVHVLGADREVAGAAEVAASESFRRLWTEAREQYDVVVVDTSPVNVTAETAVIAREADACVFVVAEFRTRAREALEARRRLASHGARVLGLVVNRSRGPLPLPDSLPEEPVNLDGIDIDRSIFVENEP